MSEVDALFRLLSEAPPRSAEIVKRVALRGVSLEEIARSFDVDVERARVIVFRAFLDVSSGGTARLRDEEEALAAVALWAPHPDPLPPSQGEGTLRQLWQRLEANREGLEARLLTAATAFAASPDRDRDEWLRRIAIIVVLALTAFFYWREQNKPRPPPEKRQVITPATPP